MPIATATQKPFPLDADDTHRTETFGPMSINGQSVDALFKYLDSTTLAERQAEADPTGRDAHAPGAKLDAGKPRPALVLGGFARALLEVSKVGTFGAIKYTDNGWMEVPNGEARYDDAKLRHWLYEKSGKPVDPDTQLIHAAHEAWNALARLDLMLRRIEKEQA